MPEHFMSIPISDKSLITIPPETVFTLPEHASITATLTEPLTVSALKLSPATTAFTLPLTELNSCSFAYNCAAVLI